MKGLAEKHPQMKALSVNVMRWLSVGLLLVFVLTLLDFLPPVIYHRYLSNGIYNPILFSLKKSLNYYSIVLLPLFFVASIFHTFLSKRIKKAYLLASSIVLLFFWAKTGYWINLKYWFPDFFSIKGFLFNAVITIAFVISGTVLYHITKKVSLKNSLYVGTALFVVLLILSVNSVFFLKNKNKAMKIHNNSQRKVLIIGVDGATWDIITPMLEKGLLPNIRHLMKNGSYGRLGSTIPTLSPIIWTTIATGKVKEKHGISDFVVVEDKKTPFTSNLRKTKAIWDILGDWGKTVSIVGWWVTWPADEVNGSMVSPYISLGEDLIKGGLYEDVPYQTYPDSLLKEISHFILEGSDQVPRLSRMIFGEVDHSKLNAFEKRLIKGTDWILRVDYIFDSIGRYLFGKEKPDFAAVYLQGIDVTGHMFWKYKEPETFDIHIPQSEIEKFKNVIENYYSHVDSMIGKYLNMVDEKTTVIVISDHGMHASRKIKKGVKMVELSGNHLDAPDGILIISGNGIKKNYEIRQPGKLLYALYGPRVKSDVYDITPTTIFLMGLPVAEDMDGEVITQMFTDDFLSRNRIHYIKTYEDKVSAREQKPRKALETPLDEELKERLRILGYIN